MFPSFNRGPINKDKILYFERNIFIKYAIDMAEYWLSKIFLMLFCNNF